MQQYQNPNYIMYQQPQYNPYMQRMENLQQFQQVINQPMQNNPNLSPGLNMLASLGKVVESMDMVKVADIPMDGNIYYFPKADGTEIYSKQFMPNGQTRILTFKPITDDNPNNLPLTEEKLKIGISDEVTEVFSNMLSQINARLDVLESNLTKTPIEKSRTKKEVESDE